MSEIKSANTVRGGGGHLMADGQFACKAQSIGEQLIYCTLSKAIEPLSIDSFGNIFF